MIMTKINRQVKANDIKISCDNKYSFLRLNYKIIVYSHSLGSSIVELHHTGMFDFNDFM